MAHRLLLLGLAMALLSCSPSATTVPNSDWSNISFAPPLVLKLEVIPSTPNTHRCLQAGESIKIRYTVNDDSKQPIVLESKEDSVLDLVIQEPSSPKVIYRWSEQNPSQVLHRIEWQPGGSHSIEVQWTVPQKYRDYAGVNIYITGLLTLPIADGKQVLQSVPVSPCVGIPFEQR